jgi:hypothetical protein
MYKFILTSLAALTMVLVASCGSVPLAGRSSKGEKFVGSATATPVSGTFKLISASGLRCYGVYNPWEHPGLIKNFTFKCTDGRYGTGRIAMNPDLKSGIGIGKANDGTTFDLAIGWSVQQIHYEW